MNREGRENMISRMKTRRTRKIFAAAVLSTMLLAWLAESGVTYAATKNATFKVGNETVYASLAGDANGVTGATSYTQGPGTVEIMVGGQAKSPGDQKTMGLVSMPDPVNTPGGVSTTMTPPSGYILTSAYSSHYAAIGGNANNCDITLF